MLRSSSQALCQGVYHHGRKQLSSWNTWPDTAYMVSGKTMKRTASASELNQPMACAWMAQDFTCMLSFPAIGVSQNAGQHTIGPHPADNGLKGGIIEPAGPGGLARSPSGLWWSFGLCGVRLAMMMVWRNLGRRRGVGKSLLYRDKISRLSTDTQKINLFAKGCWRIPSIHACKASVISTAF